MTMDVRPLLLPQARPTLSINIHCAAASTSLGRGTRARRVAIAVSLLSSAGHAVTAKAL